MPLPRPLLVLLALLVVASMATVLLVVSAATPPTGWGWASDLPRTDLETADPPPASSGIDAPRADAELSIGRQPDAAMPGSVVLTEGGEIDIAATAAVAAEVDARGLDAGLASALDRARAAAASDGIELPVSSGYRSAREQAELLAAELAQRGSLEEALRWVFPPDRSMHVRGLAIDINSGPGADWLEAHGAPFGLCKTLSWEWWHFEWRERWQREGACPAPAQTPQGAPGP